MQSTMNPISPVGRAVLPTMQGASPDEINQLAADAEKSGLLSFADALGIKRMADMISKSGAQDPRTQDPRRKPVVQELRDAINAVLNPPAAPPAMNAGVASLPMPDDMYADVGMAGGGIVAFSNGGDTTLGPYQPPRSPVGQLFAGTAYKVPTISDLISSSRPFTVAPDLRPGDETPPPDDPKADDKASLLASTGMAALIPKPDQDVIQAEVDKSYGGIYDAIKRQDALLEKQGADVAKRADAQNRMILAMTGFRMAEAAGRPGATLLGSAGAAGAEYAKSRMAANEEFADRMDKLAEARSELDLATARLDVDKSDKAREIYESKNKTFLDEQARVQLLLIEQSKLNLAQEELDIARDELTAGDPAAYTRLMGIEQRAIDSLSDTPLYVDAQNRLIMARQKIQNAADISKDELNQATIEEAAAMKTIEALEKAARDRIWNIYRAGASAGAGSNDPDTLNLDQITGIVYGK